MTKSDLIEVLAKKQKDLGIEDIAFAVRWMIEKMNQALSTGDRIEIRGFGSFSLHKHPQRMVRNPKTGEVLVLAERHVSHFKAGKDLRDRVASARHKSSIKT